MLLEQQAIFYSIHTADIAAIRVTTLEGTRANALYKTDALWAFAVTGTDKMTISRPAGTNKPLELQAGYHVFKPGIAILIERGGVIGIKPGGNNNRTDIKLDNLILHVKINAFFIAFFHAFTTGDGVVPEAIVHIDDERSGNGLREGHIYRPPRG